MAQTAKYPLEPLISIAIKPKSKPDEEKLRSSLLELAREESLLRVRTDLDTGHTIISGTDEVDLKNIIERLVREFNVAVTVGKPQVAYKETVRKSVEQEGKFIRQTGGRGQYGHVYIKVEPRRPATGVQFVDEVKGGRIPREFIRGVEKGIREALDHGPLGGYPITDVKVTLLDGSYHDVDSSEISFKIAASMAFKDAMRKASPVLLEPIMSIEVVTVEEFLGEVVGDLSSRRGKVLGMASSAGTEVIHAEAPLACMLGYAVDIRTITQGRATYTMKFKAYVEAGSAPPDPDDNEPVSMAKRVA